MKSNKELLRDILSRLDALDYVKPEQIPDIPLYMDQLTTFMDERLEKSKRYPEDKVLTKTMINNYAKNNLLPPPSRKKYTKEHTLLLIFIYYFKNMLSFHDIEALFDPITEEYFASGSQKKASPEETDSCMDSDSPSLEDIYREIFSLEKEQMKRLKEDIVRKFRSSSQTFGTDGPDSRDAEASDQEHIREPEADREYLRLFAFICELGFDVYLKKQIMEYLIDEIRESYPPSSKKKK